MSGGTDGPGDPYTSDGTDRADRLLPGLAGDRFPPVGRSLAERLALGEAQAGFTTWFDREGRPAGPWTPLLRSDPAVLCAVLQVAAERERRRERRGAGRGPDAATALAGELRAWLRAAAELGPGAFGPAMGSALMAARGQVDAALASAAPVPALRGVLQNLAVPARAELGASLGSGRHGPAMGLYLASLQLLQSAEAAVRRFGDRHRDFYYRDVLRVRPAPAERDEALLALEPVPGRGPFVLPRGVCFGGGKDARGMPVPYASLAEVTVLRGAVRRLVSIVHEHDPLRSPMREAGAVTGVRLRELELEAGRPRHGGAPLFVAPETGADGVRARPAPVGFAVASRLLRLGAGHREIDLRVRLHVAAGDPAALADLGTAAAEGEAALAEALGRRLPTLLGGRPSEWAREPLRAAARALLDARRPGAGALHTSGLLRALLGTCVAPGSLFLLFRCVLTLALWDDEDWLAGSEARIRDPSGSAVEPLRNAVLDAFERVAAADRALVPSVKTLRAAFATDRSHVWFLRRLRRQVLRVALTTGTGWHEPSRAVLDAGRATEGVLRMRVRLPPSAPAVLAADPAVHGAAWPTRLPILRLLLAPDSVFYGLSLFRGVDFSDVALEVRVRGLAPEVVSGDQGPIDASRPFEPFGPRPRVGSGFAVGSAEAASKPLRRLRLELTWAGLPAAGAGFPGHYEGWPEPLSNEAVQVRCRWLRGGRWEDAGGPAPLFATSPPGSLRIAERSTVEVAVPRDAEPRPRGPADGIPGPGPAGPPGSARIELVEPATAFGHELWPRLFAASVTENARPRWPWSGEAARVPAAPWTPTVEKVTLAYEAVGAFPIGANGPSEALSECLFHVHPLGIGAVPPVPGARTRPLLPSHDFEAATCLGIEAEALGARLHLAFRFAGDSGAALVDGDPGVRWSVLCRGGWRTLDGDRVVEDSTRGLLRSGTVCLELPDDVAASEALGHSVGVPEADADAAPGAAAVRRPALYWIRVSVRRDAGAFPTLEALYLNGVRAVATGTAAPEDRAGARWQVLDGAERIARVVRLDPLRDLRPAEDDRAFTERVSERVRHRARAVTPWDYERIVLEAFPGIRKVKCLPVPRRAGRRRSGAVLVVLVPGSREEHLAPTAMPRVDAATVRAVRDHLRDRAPPGAAVEVRSAGYEQVQVRCTVRLKADRPEGEHLFLLNAAIVEHLSPWRGRGPVFGWRILGEDVLAMIAGLDFVEAVGGLSLLRLAADPDGGHSLFDTAVPEDGPDAVAPRLSFRDPWSLAVPMPRHFVQTTRGPIDPDARIAGVGTLRIESTWVVPRARATERTAP